MAAFQYFAVDRTGRHVRGRMEAANENDLEQRLRRMGLDMVTGRLKSKTEPFSFKQRISREDLINFCFHLEQISRSGIPLLEGLEDLIGSIDNRRFRNIISAMHEDMEGGKLLSQALAQHPAVFDRLFFSLIRTGEQTGNMTEVLHDLAATLKWQDELISKTKLLLFYPVLVVTVVVPVVFFLMLYLVPKLVTFLNSMNQALPLQTRILIRLSEIFVGYWPLLLGLPLALIVIGASVVRTNANARLYWDYLKLNLPLIGPVLQQILLARFASYFALLYRSGITILDALASCEGVVANRYVADGLHRAAQQISAGDSLTDSLRNLGLFPSLVVRMIRIGETTGALDVALLEVNYFYQRSVGYWIERALKLLPAMLTIVLGSILAFIIFSVFFPLYDMLGKITF
ncbi:MAG: type II secretion system F family protein [Burkholderiales bacterium]